MGNSTSFADLITQPASEKIFLAEINVAEHLLGWSLTGGQANTYEINFLNETIALTDETTEIIRKVISGIEENGTALTVRTSIANVEANAGSYWHDTANAKIYVHPTGSDHPKDYTIIGYFWLYFATKGIELNGKYYEPYIPANGIPALNQSNPNLYWGVIAMGQGSLRLLNERGYFDQISKRFIWTNKDVKILVGGDSLPYSEYKILNSFKIVGKQFTRQEFTLQLGAEIFNLMRTVPVNKFWGTDYPSLDPAAEGLPIPIYYGVYNSSQAPFATCIHTTYGANTYQFKICDHALSSFTQAYIDNSNGLGWQSIVSTNLSTANATFTITSTAFILGASRVKAAFQGKPSSGVALQGAPEIVEDFFVDVLGYATSNLNSSSFTNSKAESDVSLNVPIDMESDATLILEGICRSDLAFADIDENGRFRYRTWIPYLTTAILSKLDEEDYLHIPEATEDDKDVYPTIRIGYNYSPSAMAYKYYDKTSTESQYKYGKKERLKFDTYLKTESDATILGQRLNLLMKDPTVKLNMELKMPVIDHLLGDKIKITMKRVPYEVSSGYRERIFEISGKDISAYPFINRLEAFDLKGFGANIGIWTSANAPNWTSANEAQKAKSGFWLGSSDYAASTDVDSRNVSIWW